MLSAELLSRVWFFVTLWTVACQVPLSMGIPQARILEWVAYPFSRESSQPRNQTGVSCIAGGFFTILPTMIMNISIFTVSGLHWPQFLSFAGLQLPTFVHSMY